jgi:monoamine oxidase
MVIIIGAGAAGMMAARILSTEGIPVLVLEARDRLGGRIHSTREPGFSFPVEAGAEFVHGDLPLTQTLLQEAGIPVLPSGGKMYRFDNGQWQRGYTPVIGWDEVITRMGELETDMPVLPFLETHFPGTSNEALRNAVRRFAEGYDLADIMVASTHALYNEWSKEESTQYRVQGGYSPMISFMAGAVEASGGRILLEAVVQGVTWEPGSVSVKLTDGRIFAGSALLVTIPLPFLQDHPFALPFTPALPDYRAAADALGYGSVIKILLQFQHAFWQDATPGLGFLLSDQPLPTWWTQSPGAEPLITGWFAGPRTKAFAQAPLEEIIALALNTLGAIFGIDPLELKDQLLAARVDDWSRDPFSLGAYSFPKVGDEAPRRLLNTPVAGTLFFAGEALYEGEATPGTVEAALATGVEAAKRIVGAMGVRPGGSSGSRDGR